MQLSDEEVAQFLPRHKMSVSAISGYRSMELENTVVEIVLSKLRPHFSGVGDWDANPPVIVKSIICKMLAGYLYSSHFSDSDTEMPAFGEYLINNAHSWIEKVINGELDIDEVEDEEKLTVGDVKILDDPVFTMGERF